MWTSSKQRASRCGDMLFGGRQIAKVDGHNVGVGLALGLGWLWSRGWSKVIARLFERTRLFGRSLGGV